MLEDSTINGSSPPKRTAAPMVRLAASVQPSITRSIQSGSNVSAHSRPGKRIKLESSGSKSSTATPYADAGDQQQASPTLRAASTWSPEHSTRNRKHPLPQYGNNLEQSKHFHLGKLPAADRSGLREQESVYTKKNAVDMTDFVNLEHSLDQKTVRSDEAGRFMAATTVSAPIQAFQDISHARVPFSRPCRSFLNEAKRAKAWRPPQMARDTGGQHGKVSDADTGGTTTASSSADLAPNLSCLAGAPACQLLTAATKCLTSGPPLRRVSFARGPLPTEDGHPRHEGRQAAPRSANPTPTQTMATMTYAQIDALEAELGPDNQPSLKRLQRRIGLLPPLKRSRDFATPQPPLPNPHLGCTFAAACAKIFEVRPEAGLAEHPSEMWPDEDNAFMRWLFPRRRDEPLPIKASKSDTSWQSRDPSSAPLSRVTRDTQVKQSSRADSQTGRDRSAAVRQASPAVREMSPGVRHAQVRRRQGGIEDAIPSQHRRSDLTFRPLLRARLQACGAADSLELSKRRK